MYYKLKKVNKTLDHEFYVESSENVSLLKELNCSIESICAEYENLDSEKKQGHSLDFEESIEVVTFEEILRREIRFVELKSEMQNIYLDVLDFAIQSRLEFATQILKKDNRMAFHAFEFQRQLIAQETFIVSTDEDKIVNYIFKLKGSHSYKLRHSLETVLRVRDLSFAIEQKIKKYEISTEMLSILYLRILEYKREDLMIKQTKIMTTLTWIVTGATILNLIFYICSSLLQ